MSYISPQQADAGITDDDLSSVLGLSQNASQQSKLDLQQRLANALRQKEGTKGQVIPGGSVFIPPNPLTTAMDTFDRLQSTVSAIQGKKKGDDLDADRQKGLERFAKLWFNRNKSGVATDPTADENDPSTLTGPPQASAPPQQGPPNG